MKTYTEMLPHIEGHKYETHFWNAIRGKQGHKEHLVNGIDTATGAFTLTPKGQDKYMAAIKQEGLFRSLATDIQIYDHAYNIKTVEGDDVAVWVPEGGTIPITDGMADFSDIALESHKLAVFLKLEDALIRDLCSQKTVRVIGLRISDCLDLCPVHQVIQSFVHPNTPPLVSFILRGTSAPPLS